MDIDGVMDDFEFLKKDDRVLAVLVFGSHVKEEAHEGSDVDVCIVAPESDPLEVLGEVWENVDTEGKNYDVHTFEELSLKMKHQVMENHETVWSRDRYRLQEYFYRFRKLWKDQAIARGVA